MGNANISKIKIIGATVTGIVALSLLTTGINNYNNRNDEQIQTETTLASKEEQTEDSNASKKGVVLTKNITSNNKGTGENATEVKTIMGKDGEDGKDGKDGINGVGIDGKNGKDGRDGKDGIGINGKPGATGISGKNGIDAKGIDGKDGNDGNDGNDGKDGKSAYSYALDGGYKGTEQDLANTLATAQEKIDEATEIAKDAKRDGMKGSYTGYADGSGTGVLYITNTN